MFRSPIPPAGTVRLPLRLLALLATVMLVVAACGDSDDDSADSGGDGGSCDRTITLGYSAWPGWFPWAVAEEEGFFEDNDVDVSMQYFEDYVASLDAMAAGQLDGNSQTLNDTMASVAAGSDQVIVIVNDNSTGNDQIIVDAGIQTVEDLRGKTVAAEAGVVTHFLLLQGLEANDMTEADINFVGLANNEAAVSFVSGDLDGVGVYAPATLEAIKREGSHILFTSADYPGTIPDHLAVTPELVSDCPDEVQAIVDTWYQTMDFLETNWDDAVAILAAKAGVSVEEYEAFADGTTLFTPEQAMTAFAEGDDTTSLAFTADLINPFLVNSGLTEQEADISNLFDSSFTQAHIDNAE